MVEMIEGAHEHVKILFTLKFSYYIT